MIGHQGCKRAAISLMASSTSSTSLMALWHSASERGIECEQSAWHHSTSRSLLGRGAQRKQANGASKSEEHKGECLRPSRHMSLNCCQRSRHFMILVLVLGIDAPKDTERAEREEVSIRRTDRHKRPRSSASAFICCALSVRALQAWARAFERYSA